MKNGNFQLKNYIDFNIDLIKLIYRQNRILRVIMKISKIMDDLNVLDFIVLDYSAFI